ncbi:SfnB family sulfur acquisition oxidoreductase [Saccharopolyspora gloriosae]|uniref:Alkylation response protein AidB-like acyl-CoA dehydrogenase n=1 Tax=Saccharopolyspora gloriosae TaxID=455344 RepID=A0A840NHJ7_9PSEU|nr:acyl-CoA dehydrogenase family protein [Saccharopolyspora gloriosae]MBB5069535.1 alkylation response protein AidB-like acyl-CoA dehydrogenase [Saccharopolyspora gloriosae]
MSTREHDAEVHALLAAIRERRSELAEGGFAADRDNADPAANMALLAESGAARLAVPAEFGGLWDGAERGGWGALIRAVREISAGDGPTGQNWLTTALVARELFGPAGGFPEATRAALARRMLDDGLRFVSSVAETGGPGRVTARPVEGGVVLSGTKTFNSNSGGRGMARVSCLLEGPRSAHQVLVDLNHDQVESHDDWDNMGQRGTRSQTLTYRDVFVPDGWHRPAEETPSPVFLAAVMLLHAALMQGIGDGALDALVGHARTMHRGSLPRFATPAEDPLVLRRVGALSSALAASRALLHSAADALEDGAGGDDVTADCFRAKVAAVEASLAATTEIHEITGARSTSHTHRYDRFWRNARTFASHDPTDAKNVYIGGYELTGHLPPLSTIIRR